MRFGLNNNLSALPVAQEKINALVAAATGPVDRVTFFRALSTKDPNTAPETMIPATNFGLAQQDCNTGTSRRR
jgi:hypothetical protein